MNPKLRWISEILWSGAPGVAVTLGADHPPGHEVVERYLVLPNARLPRFLISDGPGLASGAALATYNALRPPGTRLARAILGAGLRRGMTQRIFRDRLTVSVPGTMSRNDVYSATLSGYLRRVLPGERRLVLAIGLRDPGPNTKPVVQVFNPDGSARGYVKLGWNEFTQGLVRTEAAFLQGAPTFETLRVPRLIHHERWRGLEISVAAPLPADVRRFRPPSRIPPPATTWEIARMGGIREASLGASAYWHGLRGSTLSMVTEGADRMAEVVSRCMDRIEDRYGDTFLTFGRWHGDWVPWNLAWHEDRLVAWDWEHTGRDVPLGFDIVHFLFQLPFARQRKPLRESIGQWRRRTPAALSTLGVPAVAQPAVLSTYLLQMFARYRGAQLAGAGVNPRFFPDILDVLAREAKA